MDKMRHFFVYVVLITTLIISKGQCFWYCLLWCLFCICAFTQKTIHQTGAMTIRDMQIRLMSAQAILLAFFLFIGLILMSFCKASKEYMAWQLQEDGLYLDAGNGYQKMILDENVMERLQERKFLVHANSERIYILIGGEQPALQALSEDKGKTWVYSHLPDTYNIFSQRTGTTYFREAFVGFPTNHDGWLVTQAEKGILHIFRSIDGGRNWIEGPGIDDDAYVHHLNTACFVDEKRAFLCYSLFDETPAPVFYTSDGGHSWNKLSIPSDSESPCQVVDILFDDNRVVLCMEVRHNALSVSPSYEKIYLISKLPRKGNKFNWKPYTKNPLS